MDNLPSGWAEVVIEDVAEVNPRKSVDLSDDELVSFVPMSAIDENTGTIKGSTDRPLKNVSKGFTQFAENDVIFAKITPSMENGKAAVAKNITNAVGFGSTEFHVFRSNGAVLPEFLWYFIRQHVFRQNARKVMSGAVGQQRVPANYLKSHSLLLPPLAEQKRIVDKLESLITRTTRVRDELAHVPALIEMYKSAVFKMAFSGSLTADLHDKTTEQTSEIPASWTITKLGDISEIQGGVQVGKRRDSQSELIDVPYLRVANVQRGWLSLNEIKTISVTPSEKTRLLLKRGDVLMNEGGDRDKLGRGWVWHEEIPECIHQNHVFRIRMKAETLPPEFVSHYANEHGQKYFFDQGTQTTNLASISKGKVAALTIPTPPYEEAIEIVRRIDSVFGWLERMVASHTDAYQMLYKLNNAILSSAFSGRLVSQLISEEPASALIAKAKQKQTEKPATSQSRKQLGQRRQEKEVATEKSIQEILTEANDWLSAQIIFQRYAGDNYSTDVIERFYADLRDMDKARKLEVETVVDTQGRKSYDQIRLKGESNASR